MVNKKNISTEHVSTTPKIDHVDHFTETIKLVESFFAVLCFPGMQRHKQSIKSERCIYISQPLNTVGGSLTCDDKSLLNDLLERCSLKVMLVSMGFLQFVLTGVLLRLS